MLEIDRESQATRQPQITELIGGLLLSHKKMEWMLRSTLKID